MPKSTVYGPVASWRLGRSLGVDIICTEGKTCNFDCVYCQLGKTANLQTQRQEFVTLSRLIDDLNAVKGVTADYVTFSGMGEPTLAANLGAAIAMAKFILGLPVSVLTNASLINQEDVRRELALADVIVAKLDAAEETLFQKINRPAEGVSLAKIIQGLQAFRMEYKGKLAIEIMFTEMNRSVAYNLSYMAKFAIPDEVHLNTPLRPSDCKPLSNGEVAALRRDWFWNMSNVISVYEAKRPEVTPLNMEETELRHPTKLKSEAAPAQPSAEAGQPKGTQPAP